MNVAVIGAGVTGLTCACELVDRGVSVQLYEQSERPGDNNCSRLAGGMLAPWCERESAEQAVVDLGVESADWWQRHVSGVICKGTVVVATGRDHAELKRFARMTGNHQWLDAAGITELEPDLGDRFDHGLYFADEAHLNPRDALDQLLAYLSDRGTDMNFGQQVSASELDADHIIDCRGFHARHSLQGLRGVRGEMLLVRSSEIRLDRPVRLLHPRIPVYVAPWGDDRFMIGATMIENERRSRISVRSVLELLSSAYALHPLFGEAELVESNADVRPAFIDNLPRVVRMGRVIHVNGMYRHGFLLAPAMARQVADMIIDPSIPTSAVQ